MADRMRDIPVFDDSDIFPIVHQMTRPKPYAARGSYEGRNLHADALFAEMNRRGLGLGGVLFFDYPLERLEQCELMYTPRQFSIQMQTCLKAFRRKLGNERKVLRLGATKFFTWVSREL